MTLKGIEMKSRKRPYPGLMISIVGYTFENTLLTGSETTMMLDVEVEVDDFVTGFDSEPGGFKEIGFE